MPLTPEGKQRRDQCIERIPHSPNYQTAPHKGCDCYWCSQPRVWTSEYREEMEGGDAKDRAGTELNLNDGQPIGLVAVVDAGGDAADPGPGEIIPAGGGMVTREDGGF